MAMRLKEIKGNIPGTAYESIRKSGIDELRPGQEKAIHAGLLDGKNLLVCTPTASGKTLIAELCATKAILEGRGKAIYICPLKALASEKYRDMKERYKGQFNIAIAIGNMDSKDSYLSDYDMIICTSEKLDSLMRHHSPWLRQVAVVIIDEIHLLNDAGRGPTLEIIITILSQMKNIQIIGLSATIGNEKELAGWLNANLIHDEWRPVKLHKGIYFNGELEYEKESRKK